MVDMKELRKGNMVKCLTHLPIGYHVSTFPFTKILEIKYTSVETEAGNHSYKDIGPIILTEELLIDAGANKVSDAEFVFRDGESDPLPLSIIKENDKYYFSNNNTKLSINIETVHHFQNLYYALKGKDVAIKV